MKIKILLLILNFSFAQYFGANFQIGAALPKGELEAQEVPNAFCYRFQSKILLSGSRCCRN